MELLSPGHLIVIAILAAFLFFGWKQLPEMSRSLGRSLRTFRTEIKGMHGDDEAGLKEVEAPRPVADQPPASRPRPRPTASVPDQRSSVPSPDRSAH